MLNEILRVTYKTNSQIMTQSLACLYVAFENNGFKNII